MNPTELAYRKMAVGGASGFSLLIALYDTLAGDLRRAAEAERRNDIETRCREANHALLVIAHLENWMSQGSGGELAERLAAFYATLRRVLIVAQAKRSPEMLEQQMARVLNLREMWQKFELRGSSAPREVSHWEKVPGDAGSLTEQYEHSASSWSA